MSDLKDKMHQRLNRRKEDFLKRMEEFHHYIDKGKIGGEEDRLWIEEQISELERGLDICCGEFSIKGAVGVDTNCMVGAELTLTNGADLTVCENNELDFISTNYFDVFPEVLRTLNEWHRVLKSGGLLVLVCRDASTYSNWRGPLANKNRLNVFTAQTIEFYLERANFVDIQISSGAEQSLRVKAWKLL